MQLLESSYNLMALCREVISVTLLDVIHRRYQMGVSLIGYKPLTE